jgi:hypothetical protein
LTTNQKVGSSNLSGSAIFIRIEASTAIIKSVLQAGVAEWQTRSTQNRKGNRGGSSPFTGIKNIAKVLEIIDFFEFFVFQYNDNFVL